MIPHSKPLARHSLGPLVQFNITALGKAEGQVRDPVATGDLSLQRKGCLEGRETQQGPQWAQALHAAGSRRTQGPALAGGAWVQGAVAKGSGGSTFRLDISSI